MKSSKILSILQILLSTALLTDPALGKTESKEESVLSDFHLCLDNLETPAKIKDITQLPPYSRISRKLDGAFNANDGSWLTSKRNLIGLNKESCSVFANGVDGNKLKIYLNEKLNTQEILTSSEGLTSQGMYEIYYRGLHSLLFLSTTTGTEKSASVGVIFPEQIPSSLKKKTLPLKAWGDPKEPFLRKTLRHFDDGCVKTKSMENGLSNYLRTIGNIPLIITGEATFNKIALLEFKEENLVFMINTNHQRCCISTSQLKQKDLFEAAINKYNIQNFKKTIGNTGKIQAFKAPSNDMIIVVSGQEQQGTTIASICSNSSNSDIQKFNSLN